MDILTATPISNATLPAGRPARLLSLARLRTQNRRYRGSGGVSAENRDAGFRPAFLDSRTSLVYLSQFPDGSPAPVHLLDALPPELVVQRTAAGRVAAVRDSVVAGFVRDGRFLTRDQTMAELAERGREVLYA
ncbi:MAG: hypothetical protein ACREXW_08945 [Gammaproteobacteria bacterium]